jgi:hypothetical protein
MNSNHHTLCRTIYSQYDQLIVDILAASQVSHCLRNSVRFALPTGRPISLSWLRILTFLPSCLNIEEQNNRNRYLGLVVLESKFRQKVVRQVKADYTHIHTNSHLITPI